MAPRGLAFSCVPGAGNLCCAAAQAATLKNNRCRIFCQIVWKPAPTTCPGLPDFWLASVGVEAIHRHSWQLKEQLRQGLSNNSYFQVFGVGDERLQSGVLSLVPRETDCETFCQSLSEAGFALRSGFHCAPYAHRTAGTIQTGTIRFSVSALNTPGEVEAFLHHLSQQKIYK